MAVLVSDKFYTYTWLRKDGTPYYIGKGTKRRAFLSCEGHRPPKSENIIVQDHVSEADAFEAEIFLIAYYGRKDQGTGCLRNLTDGGDGVSGYIMPQHVKDKVSISKQGKSPAFTADDLQRRKAGMQGNKFRKGLSPWNTGATWSEETKQKMRKPHKTFTKAPMSEQHKAAIRATLQSQVTPEYIELMKQRGKRGAAARWERG